MPLLSDAEIEVLGIERFIFHVVHHKEDHPILFDDTPIAGFEDFFLDRVRETLLGNRFVFLEGSVTQATLSEVALDINRFVEVSKTLARAFHTRQDKRIKAGVLIVMVLRAGDRQFYSLIKYDHEQVIGYDVKGDTKAVLKEIKNTFTKSTEALQKSALIELTPEGGDIVVIDRKVRSDITDFFKGFLNAKRTYSQAQLTEALEKVVKDTVKLHKDTLPPEIVSKVQERLYTTVQLKETFEKESFFSEFFGAHGTDQIRKTYDKHLRNRNLDGETFTLQKDVIARPRPKRYSTVEGVDINIKEQAQDTVQIEDQPGGGVLVKIRTAKLIQR